MKIAQMQTDLGANVFLKSARDHSRLVLGAAFLFTLLLGMGIGNSMRTEDAMKGQADYFQHVYTPKVVAKVASDVAKKVAQNCPPAD